MKKLVLRVHRILNTVELDDKTTSHKCELISEDGEKVNKVFTSITEPIMCTLLKQVVDSRLEFKDLPVLEGYLIVTTTIYS